MINQLFRIVAIEWCFVDIAINCLFWETCHALDRDPSRNIAANGEKITGGKFSYIKDFQNAFHEKLTGEWNLSTVLSFDALLNFAAWYGESMPDINFSSSWFDGFLRLKNDWIFCIVF